MDTFFEDSTGQLTFMNMGLSTTSQSKKMNPTLLTEQSSITAKISLSQEGEPVSKETEAVSSEKYLESLPRSGKRINLNGSSMKMLRECLAAIKDLTSFPYSLNLTGGGTTLNGSYSTLNCTEYLKTESESILSDILEAEVPEKYFLSAQQMERIVFNTNKMDSM